MPFSPDPPAVLWRGFRHQWRYNHFPLRLGSTVHHLRRDPSSLVTEYRIGHPTVAAGADTVSMRDRFTELQAHGVMALPKSAHFELPAMGGSDSRRFELPLAPPHDPEHEVAVVLLNGFDLRFGDNGLTTLALEIDGPIWQEGQAPTFGIEVWIDGQEPESSTTGNGSGDGAFHLSVELLALIGDSDTMQIFTGARCENQYPWDTETPVEREDLGIRTAIFEGPGLWPRDRAEIALGYRGFSLALSPADDTAPEDAAPEETAPEPLRFLEWDLANRRLRWRDGAVHAEIEMFFKNWRPGMDNAQPPDSLRSRRQAGTARMTVDPVLLQFDRAATMCCEHRIRIASASSAQESSDDLAALHEEHFRVEGR